ncbi:efflux RND transporter periplasmic adaptor subunit [Nitrosomonas sp. wSCUT-2]
MKQLLFLGVMMLLAACDQAAQPSQSPRPALIMVVGNQTTIQPIILVGEVRSRYESTQGFRLGGKITERLVEVGSIVKKGQLLAKLDSVDTVLSKQAAQAQVRAAEADLDVARTELDRQKKLFQSNFISDQAVAVYEARYKVALSRLNQFKAQATVVSNQSKYTNLIAERDGVITEIHAEPGQVVEPGDVVARISSPSHKEVAVVVPESRMGEIEIDSIANIRLWSDPQTVYQGKVRQISPVADQVTRTFQIRITLFDPGKRVQFGMTAEVRLGNQQEDSKFLLPSPAATQYNNTNVVWIVDQQSGQVNPREVVIDTFREDGVTIREGLEEGDWVVVAGVQKLIPGQVVRPALIKNLP